MADKRKSEKKKLVYANAKEIFERQESGNVATLKLPDNVERLSFDKKTTLRFDIMPYRVGKGNPFADEGAIWCERSYYTHRQIGPDNKTYVCPALSSGGKRKCPICEERSRLLRTGGDKDLIKSLKASHRQLWNIKDLNDEGKLKILDVSHYCFGEVLKAKVDASEDDDHYETYFHLENGYTLRVTVGQEDLPGGKFYMATNIEMKERKTSYDDDVIDESVCLDDCIVELSYEKLKAIFAGSHNVEDTTDDDSDDDSSDDEDVPAAKHKASANGKEKAKKPPVDDDDDEDDIDGSDLESDEDDSEIDDSEDDEDDGDSDLDSSEDDDEDEPAPPKKKPGRPAKK